MRNLILILSLFTFLKNVNGQLNNNIFFSLSESISKEIRSNKSAQYYSGTNINIGYQLNNNKGGININGIYSFSGNLSGDQIYNLQSHFLGGSIKYIFRNRTKTFRPFLKVSALTEIATNYKNGFLVINSYVPRKKPLGLGMGYSPYFSHFYHSTPFVGSVAIGCDFRLTENLHLNLGVGYGFRIMKTKYASWYKNADLNEKLETIPTKNIRSHMIDFQLGLTYAFSFKKKPENTKN